MEYDGADYVVYAVTVSNEWLCISVFNATRVFGQLRDTLIFTIIVSLRVVFILLLILVRSNRNMGRSV